MPNPDHPHPDERVAFLASRSPEQLAGILRARPDARWGAPLAGLDDLAARLGHPSSTHRAMLALPMPGHQLLHAALATGRDPTVDRLLDILAPGARSPAEHTAAVERVVDDLAGRALLWRRADGTLRVDATLASLIDRPMNIGTPVRTHLARIDRHELERMGALWEVPSRGSSVAAERAKLASVLTDPAQVRAMAKSAPRAVKQFLDRLATEQVDQVEFALGPGDPEAENWARQRGLVFGGQYYGLPEIPVEVLLAIRAGALLIPFEPDPPPGLTAPVSGATLPAGAAAAAGEFTQSVAALVDRLGRTPAAALKSGGIGSREVTKIGKALAVDDTQVRFGLELLRELGLLAGAGGAVGLVGDAAGWRALDPADRYTELAAVWFELPIHPTVDRDADDKVVPAVGRRTVGGSARELRVDVLTLIAGLPEGRGVTDLDDWVGWQRPALPLRIGDVRAIWREAHALGVLVGGALSPLGRALRDDDPDRLSAIAADLLAPASSGGRFGSDLTVMVAGSPSAAVSRLLDTCADREGRGAAVVWRFSPASVRRAFDEGWTADELLAALRRAADAELPQPLTYLVADVARRHGHLVVLPAACCVRSADPALIAEVVAHRSLQKLGPYLVTPEVVSFQHPPAAVVTALRAAGYLPVPADEHGVVDLRRDADSHASGASVASGASGRRRAVTRRPDRSDPETAADIEAFAAGLLRAAGATNGAGPPSPAAEAIEPFTDRLAEIERHQLAWAIDHQAPVTISYHASTGGVSTRTISDLELVGDQLYAWCHLREDQRVFSLRRIIGVVPVGGAPIP